MDITLDVVAARRSVRRYEPRPIEADKIARLRELTAGANAAAGLALQLVTDEPDAFGRSFLARYGHFKNVRNYIAVVAPDSDEGGIAAGRHGEKIVLEAKAMGLDNCWVGLTFKRGKVPVDIVPGMKLHAVIALGYGAETPRAHKSKKPADVSEGYGRGNVAFDRGVDCALLAPTALNRQNFRFVLGSDGTVTATAKRRAYAALDLGIAVFHFELASGLKVSRMSIS